MDVLELGLREASSPSSSPSTSAHQSKLNLHTSTCNEEEERREEEQRREEEEQQREEERREEEQREEEQREEVRREEVRREEVRREEEQRKEEKRREQELPEQVVPALTLAGTTATSITSSTTPATTTSRAATLTVARGDLEQVGLYDHLHQLPPTQLETSLVTSTVALTSILRTTKPAQTQGCRRTSVSWSSSVQEVPSSPQHLDPVFSQELEQAEEQPQELEKSVHQEDLQTDSGAKNQEQERRMLDLASVMWGGKKLGTGRRATSKQASKRKVTEVLTPGSYTLKKARFGSSGILHGVQVPAGVRAGVVVQQEGGGHGRGGTPSPGSGTPTEASKEQTITCRKARQNQVLVKTKPQKPHHLAREETITQAVAHYQAGNSLKACKEKFGVATSTVHDRAKGKHGSGWGRKSEVFTWEEEEKLTTAMDVRAGMGVGFGYPQMALWIQILLKDLISANPGRRSGFEETDQFPPYDFCRRVAKRHDMILRKAWELSKGREQLTEEELRVWQDLTEKMMQENADICQDPRRLWNYDETSFERSAGNIKVLRKRGKKLVPGRSSGSRNHSTLCVSVNGAGEAACPRFVLEGKRDVSAQQPCIRDLEPGVRTGEPRFSFTDSGFVNHEIFLKILQDVHDYCVLHKITLPVIVFQDGALCHISQEGVLLAEQLQIKLWLLCPNATHLIQPLDVAVFGPFKRILRKKVWWWHGEAQNMHITLSKWMMVPLVLESLEAVLASDKEYVAMGWRKSGLLPFSREAVDLGALQPSKKFRPEGCDDFPLWPTTALEQEVEQGVELGVVVEQGLEQGAGQGQDREV